LQIKQRRSNTGIPTTSRWGSKPCNIMNCMTCHLISDCSNITSTLTRKTFRTMGDIDCSSSNVIYAYQCYFCNKQYVGETSTPLRIRANGHRFTIERKHRLSSLYTHNHISLYSPWSRILVVFRMHQYIPHRVIRSINIWNSHILILSLEKT